MSTYIMHSASGSIEDADVGGKAAALAHLLGAGLPIPDWFVVRPEALRSSLDKRRLSTLDAACQSSDAPAAQAALEGLTLEPMVQEELRVALECPAWDGQLVAVRSSAPDEDGLRLSFAGQLDSFLNVPIPEVAGRIVDVWRSNFSERLLAYRLRNSLATGFTAPAVIVQRMVAAMAAGVVYSADPVSGRRGTAVVSSAPGLGDRLVSGACDADTYHVSREGRVIARSLAGVTPSLADEQVCEVAALARRCERYFKVPQDIEWAYSRDGRLWLLQSRPITGLGHLPDPDGSYARWDNSNIAESYSGVTTPLTFSFASHAYQSVYRQLCRLMGVPQAEISRHDEAFGRMIGLIRGRIYYNLLSWYELLALAPGFAESSRFMEQMMGVREGLPKHIVASLPTLSWRGRWRDRFRLVTTIVGLLKNYLQLQRSVERFTSRTELALAESERRLESTLRPDELVAHYRELERRLLTHWDAPLVNDLFTMIWFGRLRRLSRDWCGDSSGSFASDLISSDGNIVSAEPAIRVGRMASLAACHPRLTTELVGGSLSAIKEAMGDAPEFEGEFSSYLHKFADRCLDELKLESPTLEDDPLPLLRSVGQLAGAVADGSLAAGTLMARARGSSMRLEAERRLSASLAHHPVRRVAFLWILRQARLGVRNRENLRFLRTRVFGRVRHIFVELGNRFYAFGLLERPEDIFYLEVEEALGLVAGTATTHDIRGLVTVRRAEFARYRDELEPPPDSFETYGMVLTDGKLMRCSSNPSQREVSPSAGEALTGTGCCPGVVSGSVRVVSDPRHSQVKPGEILVAERTDPGWVLLFASAAGVVVEHGSLLSHTAIVTRELGIPSVVAVEGATRWLQTGDWIQLDGSSGVITRILPPETEAVRS
jgi:rifampicin phosphotransferase